MKAGARDAVLVVVLAVTVTVAGCGSTVAGRASDDGSRPSASPLPTAAPSTRESPPALPTAPPSTAVAPPEEAIFGPGCGQLPVSGPGSPAELRGAPVATALASSPPFATLVSAITAAGIVDTMNSVSALTVLAPVDSAWAAVPTETLDALLSDTALLTDVVLHHLVPEGLSAADLVTAGQLTTILGDTVSVTGTPEAPVIGGAQVLCGNLAAANATIFAIDTVLLPAS